ncbi:hypothetical protein SELMODRAFT_404410 [Selaginella moellendorffii]|uniref:Uncharacterized protein n=1 Tax=Selaginella moellendorffii TaxID=88036 RepID=D8QV85_SELML|nr:hypothetical protein SELMODRAFT_404410 [Selaginella moellendorffii]
MQVERGRNIGSCSSTGSDALAVRRDRRRRQPSWMKFLRPEHLQQRDCWLQDQQRRAGFADDFFGHDARFKSEAFQVAIPPKIVVSTAAIVPKASSSKEFRVVEMAEFGEVRGVYIYESRRKVLELEPLQYLEFYPCNVIVGNMFCFLAKSGRNGYVRVMFYDMEAEALTDSQLSFSRPNPSSSIFESVALELLITHDLRDCMLLDHKI